MDELEPIQAAVSGLIERLEPASRRQLARIVAADLRSTNAKRIAEQRNPDGSAYEPRKTRIRSKKGSIRRQMFSRLRTSRWMKVQTTPDTAIVTFADQVQRMAQVHHLGLRDKVNRKKTDLEVQYPARKLLGYSDADVSRISETVIDFLAR